VAAGAGPSWPVPAADSGNQQGDAQREHTPMFLSKGEQCVKELQGMELLPSPPPQSLLLPLPLIGYDAYDVILHSLASFYNSVSAH